MSNIDMDAIRAERDEGFALQRAVLEALAKLDPEKRFQAFALRALGEHYGEATEDEQDRATQFTCAEEVEPCETALCSRSDEGTWILGWIWSPAPEDEDEEADDCESGACQRAFAPNPCPCGKLP